MTVTSEADRARERLVDPLPAGARLLHIGIPKSGTTTVQRGAGLNREALHQYGVCYPGREFNHRAAVAGLMGRRLGWKGRGDVTPPRSVWNSIATEIRQSGCDRALVSHEFACEADDQQAAEFAAALGDGIHVVITLRGFADLLGSSWQQYVKAGYRRSFESWLKAVLGKRPKVKTTPTFYQRNDQAAIVQRWVRTVGADNVTVIIADKHQPDLLINAFEDMLGLPPGLLQSRPLGGFAENRSLSAAESELVFRLNQILREESYDWPRYEKLIRNGMIARIQQMRKPGPDEQMPVLPTWAARKALRTAKTYATAIEASGCRIIGDPTRLYAPVRSSDARHHVDQMPVDAAVHAVAGVLSAGDGRGAFFDHPPEGVQGVNIYPPSVRKLMDSRRGLEIAHTVRATQHIPVSTLAAATFYRGSDRAKSRLKPVRKRAEKMIRRFRKRIR